MNCLYWCICIKQSKSSLRYLQNEVSTLTLALALFLFTFFPWDIFFDPTILPLTFPRPSLDPPSETRIQAKIFSASDTNSYGNYRTKLKYFILTMCQTLVWSISLQFLALFLLNSGPQILPRPFPINKKITEELKAFISRETNIPPYRVSPKVT